MIAIFRGCSFAKCAPRDPAFYYRRALFYHSRPRSRPSNTPSARNRNQLARISRSCLIGERYLRVPRVSWYAANKINRSRATGKVRQGKVRQSEAGVSRVATVATTSSSVHRQRAEGRARARAFRIRNPGCFRGRKRGRERERGGGAGERKRERRRKRDAEAGRGSRLVPADDREVVVEGHNGSGCSFVCSE